jgi:hypothetical protein
VGGRGRRIAYRRLLAATVWAIAALIIVAAASSAESIKFYLAQ